MFLLLESLHSSYIYRQNKLPYNLNIFSELVAVKLLQNYAYVAGIAARLVAERQRVFTELQTIPGMTPYPSAANFLMFSTALESKQVLERVLDADVLATTFRAVNPDKKTKKKGKKGH